MDNPYWEYRDFTYNTWQPQNAYSCTSYKPNQWVIEARQFFWENSREQISAVLQTWFDQGWEALDEIGPDAISVSQSERNANIQISDIFLWIMTLGLAFILQFWLNTPRGITVYKPVEFRVKMRHRLAPYPQVESTGDPTIGHR